MVFINKKIHEIETEEAPGHSATLNQADANINNCRHDTFYFLRRPFPAVFVVIKTGIFSLNVMFNSYQVGFVPKTEAKFHHRETQRFIWKWSCPESLIGKSMCSRGIRGSNQQPSDECAGV